MKTDWRLDQVIDSFSNHFRDSPRMGALVGGLNEGNALELHDLDMGKQTKSLVLSDSLPRSIVVRGASGTLTPPEPLTIASALSLMLGALQMGANLHPDIGPPYEFLVIPRP